MIYSPFIIISPLIFAYLRLFKNLLISVDQRRFAVKFFFLTAPVK